MRKGKRKAVDSVRYAIGLHHTCIVQAFPITIVESTIQEAPLGLLNERRTRRREAPICLRLTTLTSGLTS